MNNKPAAGRLCGAVMDGAHSLSGIEIVASPPGFSAHSRVLWGDVRVHVDRKKSTMT